MVDNWLKVRLPACRTSKEASHSMTHDHSLSKEMTKPVRLTATIGSDGRRLLPLIIDITMLRMLTVDHQ